MDANAVRYLLIALASTLIVFLNFPWRSTAKSMARCATAMAATPPRCSTEQPHRVHFAATKRWAGLPQSRPQALARVPVAAARAGRQRRAA
jgi:hypothetical protein